MTDIIQLSGIIPASHKGLRLDNALVQMFPEYSRARLQKWIRKGDVSVNGETLRPKDIVLGGEHIELYAELIDENKIEPEAIELNVVFEDDHILVVNKPAGLVVHPGAGNPNGTLANALLNYDKSLQAIPRVGIVHRLDKGTSGLLVIAKKLESHANLVDQLQQRIVSRKYICLVHGEIIAGGSIDAAIGRHPVDRKRMAVTHGGKTATTHYRVRERFDSCTLLDVEIETGRTHQIRVHMAHTKFPIVGDPIYGKNIKSTSNKSLRVIADFPRQALHAASLSFPHPENRTTCQWSVPLPLDFQNLLDSLEQFKK